MAKSRPAERRTMGVSERIEQFNAGRDPRLLRRKYRAMRDNPFAFFRGTAHLFYEALPSHPVLADAPLAWCCGDLHLENLGVYKEIGRAHV